MITSNVLLANISELHKPRCSNSNQTV